MVTIEWCDGKKAQVLFHVGNMIKFFAEGKFFSLNFGEKDVLGQNSVIEVARGVVYPKRVEIVVLEKTAVVKLGELHFNNRVESMLFVKWYARHKREFWRKFLGSFARELERVCDVLRAYWVFEEVYLGGEGGGMGLD